MIAASWERHLQRLPRPYYEASGRISFVYTAISQIESHTVLASPEKAHLALEKLLRGNQIKVHQKSPGSRDYNIERTAELTFEAHTAGRPETTGRMLSVVAGAGFDRLHMAGHPFVVRMRFSS